MPSLARLAVCLALAVLGGSIATWAHLPLGWLIGALAMTAFLSLRSIEVRIVPYGRELAQGLVGIAAGQRLTPEVAERLLALMPLMFAATLATILFACLQSKLLARLTGVDGRTALFSSLPGGVAEMAVLADRYNGDPGLVSVGQFLRILLVTLTIPLIVHLLPREAVHSSILSLLPGHTGWQLGLLCLIGIALGTVFARLRIPNGWLFAGIVVGGGAGLTHLSGSSVPAGALIGAQVLIGAALGARCKPSLLKSGRIFLPHNLAGTAILIAFTVMLAWAIDHFSGLGHASLILALAPGGIAEMSLVASSMQLDLLIVVAFHLVRVVLIVLLSMPLMLLFANPADSKPR